LITATQYGSVINASPSPLNGTSAQIVSAFITGIVSNDATHFRVAASNSHGTVYGADQVFRTPLLAEGFEHGAKMPPDWTWHRINNAVDWKFQNGGYKGYPPAAHSGNYNAFFYEEAYNSSISRLITPMIDFGAGGQSAELTFWHAMTDWLGDQYLLKVYYKTSAAGVWNLLAEYDSSVAEWTLRTLTLPDTGPTYQIAFEGVANWGYGVCIDDVQITVSIAGDVNGDGLADLIDAVLALQIVSGAEPSQTVYRSADVTGDGKIGLEEAIYVMQVVAGLR
jgi:hypothetical protein